MIPLRLLALLALLALATAGAAAAASFTLTDLIPGLAGPGFTPAALNLAGQVAGTAQGPGGSRAVVWDPRTGLSAPLPLPSGFAASRAVDLNDRGQLLGHLTGGAGAMSFLWGAGSGYTLLPGFLATGLNAAGQVVGTAGSGAAARAVLWDPLLGLQTLPGASGPGEGIAINAAGQVLARDRSDAVIWSAGGGVIRLGPLLLPGGTASFPVDLSDDGRVLGATSYTAHTAAPYLWDPAGGLNGLGTLPGYVDTWPVAMNAAGQVVGGAGGFGAACCTVFLWDPATGYRDLNALVALPLGWRIDSVAGINDRGQILGQAWTGSALHPVLLTPVAVPLPAAFVALAAALGMLGALRLRRRLT